LKPVFITLFFCATLFSNAQTIASLNTAKNCFYMTEAEREMIYEINRVRSDPPSYLQYLTPLLGAAKIQLKRNGKGDKNYSLTITSTTRNGKNLGTIDTTWHFRNEEDVKALSTLITDLKKLKPLSILQPDSGIYNAAKKHAADEQLHDWQLLHTGSDGSGPLERIILFSPSMVYGNENIAGRYGYATSSPRDFVLQLLIDSGIPGYGHRYNMLDPQWTHIACKTDHFKGMHWWIQNFGCRKK
jgi:uncharacterized protein YkwD